MRLVIYDPGFAHYEPLLRRMVSTDWEVEAEWGDEGWLRQQLRSADALVANQFRPEWKLLSRHLQALLLVGADMPPLREHDLPAGCVVANVAEHAEPIAEYVFYTMLRQVTQVEEHAAAFREGVWSGSGRVGGLPHGEVAGKTISLLGFGSVGQAVARRAEAFGMRVLVKTSQREDAGFYEEADFLVVACPLTESTRRLVGRRELESLKGGAMLINVSRAEVIDETALYGVLANRPLSAALDVWYESPADLGERRYGSRYPFHELANVFLTPHLAAWTKPMIERRMRQIAGNLDRLARGEALEDVVLQAGIL